MGNFVGTSAPFARTAVKERRVTSVLTVAGVMACILPESVTKVS